jgi:putative transposase
MRAKHPISERAACRLVGIARTVLHYRRQQQPENERLSARLVELAGERRRFGYRRLHILVRREGWAVNHKRTWRLYREARLHVPRRGKRAQVAVERQPLARPNAPDATWSMDFIFDRYGEARALKILNVVDDFTKEAVDILPSNSIRGADVVQVLEQAVRFRRLPQAIRTDQGPEFSGRALQGWADERGVQLKLIEAGKPTQNAYVESFNARFRDECLNEHVFRNLAHARAVIAQWRADYNERRPHSALGYLTPREFAARCRARAPDSASPITEIGKRLQPGLANYPWHYFWGHIRAFSACRSSTGCAGWRLSSGWPLRAFITQLANVLGDISKERATCGTLRPPSSTCRTAASRNSTVYFRSGPAFIKHPHEVKVSNFVASIFRGPVQTVSRSFTRKHSSSSVRFIRSTKPLVRGERTFVGHPPGAFEIDPPAFAAHQHVRSLVPNRRRTSAARLTQTWVLTFVDLDGQHRDHSGVRALVISRSVETGGARRE